MTLTGGETTVHREAADDCVLVGSSADEDGVCSCAAGVKRESRAAEPECIKRNGNLAKMFLLLFAPVYISYLFLYIDCLCIVS